MKTISLNKFSSFFFMMLLGLFISCEQEDLEPELGATPGGGTMTTYKAYTLDSAPGGAIYGRIVFWEGNAKGTLVQVSLYNTESGIEYPSAIYTGTTDNLSATELVPLYSISGLTGEFSTHKFYVISDEDFFEKLETYDAHVNIFSGSSVAAAGNVGMNAEPVAEND